jgi:hypothetical protein
MRLLSHYWTTGEDEALRRLQADDWLEDLEEFDASIVTDACKFWRRSEKRRPTPADIRKLCIEMSPRRRPTSPPPRISAEVWTTPKDPETSPEVRAAQAAETLAKYGFRRMPSGNLVMGGTPAEEEAENPAKVWEKRAEAYDPPPDDPALIAAALKALER